MENGHQTVSQRFSSPPFGALQSRSPAPPAPVQLPSHRIPAAHPAPFSAPVVVQLSGRGFPAPPAPTAPSARMDCQLPYSCHKYPAPPGVVVDQCSKFQVPPPPLFPFSETEGALALALKRDDIYVNMDYNESDDDSDDL